VDLSLSTLSFASDQAMAETTPEPDLILSIHPQHVANIVTRVKNHEFRNYLLPVSVKRLWIYETSPASSIRYVATISHGKRPGEIRDPKGLRNDEFDRGDLEGRVKYAYEILKLEELPKPYSLTTLKSNGWLGGAPQKYCFVKPAMAAALSTTSLRLVFDSVPSVSLEGSLGDGEAKPKSVPLATRLGRQKNGPPGGVHKSKSTCKLRHTSRRKQTSPITGLEPEFRSPGA
jgi:hypothetical protein